VSLLIVGCGYVGQRVAKLWLEQGEKATALTRGGDSLAILQRVGIVALVADWLDVHNDWTLQSARCALVAVPHRSDERFGLNTHCVGLANIMDRLPKLERLVVLSTTGVYHQTDGEWVDECSPTNPTRVGPQIALAAEHWLAEHISATRATVLRLAGIYGPGRIPLLANLQTRRPIPVADGALNLIHVADIAQAIIKLLVKPAASRLYVLSDGQPVERRTFYEDAARIFATEPPVFSAVELGSSRAGRSDSHKRIDPKRIVNELPLRLQFPNHIAGLTAIASASHDSH
jgi:nucleoside-diphosphate-sugar epimerase